MGRPSVAPGDRLWISQISKSAAARFSQMGGVSAAWPGRHRAHERRTNAWCRRGRRADRWSLPVLAVGVAGADHAPAEPLADGVAVGRHVEVPGLQLVSQA